MNLKQSLTPTLTVGDQPSADDLRALPAEGYVGVVNLRNDGEPEQPLGPSAEGTLAKELGLDYYHYGVGAAPLSRAGVAGFREFLDHHAGGKTLVHCRKGGRAVALLLIHRALAEGWPADQAAAKGAAEGLNVEGGLRVLVEGYLREHGAAA